MFEGSGRGRGVSLVLLLIVGVIVVDCEGSSSPSPSPSPKALPTVNPKSQSLLEETIIRKYVAFHRANRRTGPRLIYRYNATQPGFGNRISNLLTAFTLASLSRRVLIVDWRKPYDLFTFYDPVLDLKFGKQDEDGGVKECSSVDCKSSFLDAVLSRQHRNVVYPNGLPHADLGTVKKMLRQHEELPESRALKDIMKEPLNEAQFFKKMFESLVRPGKELGGLLSSHSRALKEPFIAVHARLGVGLHEFGPRWGAERTQGSVAECFAKHAREVGDALGVKRVYLATDTTEFRELFQREMRKRGGEIVDVGKVEPVHTKGCNAHPRDCLMTVFEFMVLSRAKGMLANKSTFSQAAGLIGGIVERKTIAITRDC